MGAAPTLAQHLEQVRADLYISANGHGAALRPPSYVVAIDHNHSRLQVDMVDHIRRVTAAPIIGPQARADYRLAQWPSGGPGRPSFSGWVSILVAQHLGAGLVIVAGMDAHRGKSLPSVEPTARAVHCPVRVAGGGALTHFWPTYNPAEDLARPPLLIVG